MQLPSEELFADIAPPSSGRNPLQLANLNEVSATVWWFQALRRWKYLLTSLELLRFAFARARVDITRALMQKVSFPSGHRL